MRTIPLFNTTGIENKKPLRTLGLSLLLGLGILFFIVWIKAANSFQLGEHYLRAKEFEKAVLAFEQTVLTNVPGFPYQDRAIRSLFKIGDQAKAEGNKTLALQAYQAILFSEASLSVYQNISLKNSLSALDQLQKIDSSLVGPTLPKQYPDRLWSLIVGLSLLLWIGSLFLFITTGFDSGGKFLFPPAQYPLGAFILFLVIWFLALSRL